MEVFGAQIKLVDGVSGTLKKAAASSKNFDGEIKKAKSQVESFDKKKIKPKELTVKKAAATTAINEVKKKLMAMAGKKAIVIKAVYKAAVTGIKAVKNVLDKVKESKVVKIAVQGAGAAIKAGGKIAAIGLSAALVQTAAAGALAVKSAVEFESQMANVGTLLDGDVSGKLDSLGKQVKDVSISTGISTENLSAGLYEVVSAFGESADSSKQLEIAAKAAKAGNAETADSVKMLSAVTKGYGDTSAEAVQKAADLAFTTVKLGQTSFPELASSMGAVVPLASTLKVSQEELFGAMSTLTGVTGNTSEVTTQLKATMQGFMSPTKEMSKALEKMGYSSGAAALESEGLGGILNKLKDSVNGDEIAFASMFSSVEAKNAVLALAGTQAENFATKTDAMYQASGAADEAFKRQTASVKEMAAKIKNTGMVMLTSMGQKALPILSTALDKVSEHMPAFEKAVESAFSNLEPVIAAAGQLIPGLVNLWSGSFAASAPIFGAAVSNISSMISAGMPVVMAIFEGFKSVSADVFPVVGAIISDVGSKVTGVLSSMGAHTGDIQSIIAAAGPVIAETLSAAWAVAGPVLDLTIAAVGLLANAFAAAFPAISAVVEATWKIVEPIFSALGKGVSLIADAVKEVSGFFENGGGGSSVGSNATGTSYWRGGYTTVGEHGPELVSLPQGSKVYSNSKTNEMLGRGNVSVKIQNMTVREEADIDKIARRIAEEIEKVDR